MLNDGSCMRLRADRPNHVWSYDFVEDRTQDGKKFRMLCVIDEFTREALAIGPVRNIVREARKRKKGPSLWLSTRTYWTSCSPAAIHCLQGRAAR